MRSPFLAAALLCGIAAAVSSSPHLETLLVYDRTAIGEGELWRLVTGNLVHFSAPHLAYDVLALLATGLLFAIRGVPYFALLCVAASAIIGSLLYLVLPELLIYGGLSGVVNAAVTFLCLNGLHDRGRWRWLCAAALCLTAAKIGVEFAFGALPLPGMDAQPFTPVPLSHALGAASALVLYLAAAGTAHVVPRTMPGVASR